MSVKFYQHYNPYTLVDYHEGDLQNYYSKNSYGKVGVRGSLALDLIRTPDTVPEDFKLLVEGILPKSGASFVHVRRKNRQVALDVTFSLPKAVTLLLLALKDGSEKQKQLCKIIQKILKKILRKIEENTSVRHSEDLNGKKTGKIRATKKCIMFLFEHEISRYGDPQKHFHIVVINITYDKERDEFYAAHLNKFTKSITDFNKELQEEFEKELKAIGYDAYLDSKGIVHTKEVPLTLEKKYSKGHDKVESAFKKYVKKNGFEIEEKLKHISNKAEKERTRKREYDGAKSRIAHSIRPKKLSLKQEQHQLDKAKQDIIIEMKRERVRQKAKTSTVNVNVNNTRQEEAKAHATGISKKAISASNAAPVMNSAKVQPTQNSRECLPNHHVSANISKNPKPVSVSKVTDTGDAYRQTSTQNVSPVTGSEEVQATQNSRKCVPPKVVFAETHSSGESVVAQKVPDTTVFVDKVAIEITKSVYLKPSGITKRLIVTDTIEEANLMNEEIHKGMISIYNRDVLGRLPRFSLKKQNLDQLTKDLEEVDDNDVKNIFFLINVTNNKSALMYRKNIKAILKNLPKDVLVYKVVQKDSLIELRSHEIVLFYEDKKCINTGKTLQSCTPCSVSKYDKEKGLLTVRNDIGSFTIKNIWGMDSAYAVHKDVKFNRNENLRLLIHKGISDEDIKRISKLVGTYDYSTYEQIKREYAPSYSNERSHTR